MSYVTLLSLITLLFACTLFVQDIRTEHKGFAVIDAVVAVVAFVIALL